MATTVFGSLLAHAAVARELHLTDADAAYMAETGRRTLPSALDVRKTSTPGLRPLKRLARIEARQQRLLRAWAVLVCAAAEADARGLGRGRYGLRTPHVLSVLREWSQTFNVWQPFDTRRGVRAIAKLCSSVAGKVHPELGLGIIGGEVDQHGHVSWRIIGELRFELPSHKPSECPKIEP